MLNLLAREALAATLAIDARVVLMTEFPTLQDALQAEGKEFVVIGAAS